jgi:hypothetical protein
MKRIPCRVAIYPRDVQNILGKANRTAHRIINNIRRKYRKEKKQPVTLPEFCAYFQMEEDVVRRFLE